MPSGVRPKDHISIFKDYQDEHRPLAACSGPGLGSRVALAADRSLASRALARLVEERYGYAFIPGACSGRWCVGKENGGDAGRWQVSCDPRLVYAYEE